MKNFLFLAILTITVCGCANQPILDNPENSPHENKFGKKIIDPNNDPYNK